MPQGPQPGQGDRRDQAASGATPGLRLRLGSLLGDHGVFRAAWSNWAEIVPGRVYRSAHPTPGQLARAVRRAGLRTVVNLRGEKPNPSNDLSLAAARHLGLEHVFMAFESRGAPHRERVLNFHALYRRMAFPALLHCKSGADRAGLAAGLVVLFEGGTAAQASRQLSWRFGHVARSATGVLDAFFHLYATVENRIGFLDWVRDEYNEAALRQARTDRFARLLNDRVLARE